MKISNRNKIKIKIFSWGIDDDLMERFVELERSCFPEELDMALQEVREESDNVFFLHPGCSVELSRYASPSEQQAIYAGIVAADRYESNYQAPAERAADADAKWAEKLDRLGYADHAVAREIASVLACPDQAHDDWFCDAVEAVEANIERGGRLSLEAKATGWGYETIRAAIKAHRRHRDTDYDDLLAAGYSQADARALMEERF